MTDLADYRPNVGVVLFHPDGRVWLGRRAGTHGPHNWQFPQGGVDEGEALEEAARRELQEETGVTSVTYLGRTEGWLTYDFPPLVARELARGWKGQKQVWFAFRFDGSETEIDLDAHEQPEFDEWRWDYLAEAPKLIVPFKRQAYEAVAAAFAAFAATKSAAV
ncbi:MAG: RNA pyrophosphohydrolase [Phenylobacterium sp.]|uniref:RNA pyrophosphohydrolase n=1 Tax=Phenylobacterium sp. TaxID=1871053 RepID=UPI0011F6B6A1|nr:RNA pyrophosphohydrolase [Phenylobacterium sp.]TAJ69322.1 MAG: RNA pyrophosphohydrolase [Phenylobacterium sp.]